MWSVQLEFSEEEEKQPEMKLFTQAEATAWRALPPF